MFGFASFVGWVEKIKDEVFLSPFFVPHMLLLGEGLTPASGRGKYDPKFSPITTHTGKKEKQCPVLVIFVWGKKTWEMKRFLPVKKGALKLCNCFSSLMNIAPSLCVIS